MDDIAYNKMRIIMAPFALYVPGLMWRSVKTSDPGKGLSNALSRYYLKILGVVVYHVRV